MQLESYKRREKHNIAESTLKARMTALRQLKEFMGHDGEPEVEEVEEWIDHLIGELEDDKIKAGTIRQYFKSARYYFQKVHGDDEDIEHIRGWIPKGETDHGDYLDHEELDSMRKNSHGMRTKTILELMYRLARRPGEAILLNLDDITFSDEGEDEAKITWPILKKREPFRATFLIDEETEQMIKGYLKYRSPQEIQGEKEWEDETVEPLFTTQHGRVSYTTVWRNIGDVAERAGINKNITPGCFRHTRATHLDWSGESPEVIARQQMVHDPDSDVIGAYIHDRDEKKVREPLRLDDE